MAAEDISKSVFGDDATIKLPIAFQHVLGAYRGDDTGLTAGIKHTIQSLCEAILCLQNRMQIIEELAFTTEGNLETLIKDLLEAEYEDSSESDVEEDEEDFDDDDKKLKFIGGTSGQNEKKSMAWGGGESMIIDIE